GVRGAFFYEFDAFIYLGLNCEWDRKSPQSSHNRCINVGRSFQIDAGRSQSSHRVSKKDPRRNQRRKTERPDQTENKSYNAKRKEQETNRERDHRSQKEEAGKQRAESAELFAP